MKPNRKYDFTSQSHQDLRPQFYFMNRLFFVFVVVISLVMDSLNAYFHFKKIKT